MSDGEFSVILCGVGGQGLVLLSNIVGTACADAGIRVMTGEQHGLSQRSGSVSVHLRIGKEVRSPLIPIGMGDAILSLEAVETLRYVEYLKDGGIVMMNSRVMHPVTDTGRLAKDKKVAYFGREIVMERLSKVTKNILAIDALTVAKEAGNPLTENVVLLGALSALEDFPVPISSLKGAVARLVPSKAKDKNLKAFDLGSKTAHEKFCALLRCKPID